MLTHRSFASSARRRDFLMTLPFEEGNDDLPFRGGEPPRVELPVDRDRQPG